MTKEDHVPDGNAECETMDLFFSSIASNLSIVTQLAAKTMTILDDGDALAMREILNDFEIPCHRYKEAFRQLLVGCALGGGLIDETKVLRIEDALGKLAVTAIEKKRIAGILSKSLFRQIQTAGYDEKIVISVATELLSLAAKSMRKGRQ